MGKWLGDGGRRELVTLGKDNQMVLPEVCSAKPVHQEKVVERRRKGRLSVLIASLQKRKVLAEKRSLIP